LVLLLIRRPPPPTLFPYTTLFRSESVARPATTVMRHGPALLPSVIQRAPAGRPGSGTWRIQRWIEPTSRFRRHTVHHCAPAAGRSEEHTSELQSRENLVCRLLLEK